MRRRPIAALLAACLLAAPATALAQSAGDEQYADPFGEVKDPSQNTGGSNGSPASGNDTPASAPASGADNGATAGSGTGSALPHTGYPAGLGAMLGAMLLVLGASVWRRAQPPLAQPPWLTPAASRRARFGARRRRRR
jgi:hypothetical protein